MSPGLTEVFISAECSCCLWIVFYQCPPFPPWLWCILGICGAPLLCSDGPRPSRAEGFVCWPWAALPPCLPLFCSLAGAPLPFPALWSYSTFKFIGEEDRHHPQIFSFLSMATNNFSSTHHAEMRRFGGFGAFTLPVWCSGMDAQGFTETLSFFWAVFPMQGHLCAPSQAPPGSF